MPQAKDFTLSSSLLYHQLSGDDLRTGMGKLDPTPPFPSSLPTLLQRWLAFYLLSCVARTCMFSRISYPARDCKAKKWLKRLFPSQTVSSDPALWLGARLPKVTIHFNVHRDRYLLKPVLSFSPSPLPGLYFTVSSQETFLLPSKKKGEEGGEKKKKVLSPCLLPPGGHCVWLLLCFLL